MKQSKIGDIVYTYYNVDSSRNLYAKQVTADNIVEINNMINVGYWLNYTECRNAFVAELRDEVFDIQFVIRSILETKKSEVTLES
jgi:hypothetical protein